jgi:hypothetical protein
MDPLTNINHTLDRLTTNTVDDFIKHIKSLTKTSKRITLEKIIIMYSYMISHINYVLELFETNHRFKLVTFETLDRLINQVTDIRTHPDEIKYPLLFRDMSFNILCEFKQLILSDKMILS